MKAAITPSMTARLFIYEMNRMPQWDDLLWGEARFRFRQNILETLTVEDFCERVIGYALSKMERKTGGFMPVVSAFPKGCEGALEERDGVRAFVVWQYCIHTDAIDAVLVVQRIIRRERAHFYHWLGSLAEAA